MLNEHLTASISRPGLKEDSSFCRIFCFPYAGASAHAYHEWSKYLSSYISVYSICYPGRGQRLSEPCVTDLNLLIQVLYKEIRPLLGKPFIFFGHSLGALVAFELTRYLQKNGAPLPFHLIVSGRLPPHKSSSTKRIKSLSDAEFLEKIRLYDGTPAALFDNYELLELFLPILRADFSLHENYVYCDFPSLECDITAMTGRDDPFVSYSQLDDWKIHTTKKFQSLIFTGHHFFVQSHVRDVISNINNIVERYMEGDI